MTKTELQRDLINTAHKYRLDNHTTFEKAVAVSIQALKELQATETSHKLRTHSEWLRTLRRHLPFWERVFS